MSWIQKLYEVYDVMAGTEECDLLPVGFVQKKIKFNIILSANGEFVTAQQLPKEAQDFAVPSTPQAAGRSGKHWAPYPLADQLKYLIAGENQENPKFTAYIQQLSDWCSRPDAPDCLRVLARYLEKKTLLDDLMGVPNLKLRYHKDNEAKDGTGPDAASMACFSVQCMDGENRLWLRKDVCESWSRYVASLLDGPRALCYATGQMLPILQIHSKLAGNAKLISAKDDGFPFQYKGRFVEDHSAAEVSNIASLKVHNALNWLLKHQGFQRYGMHIVAWNTAVPVLNLGDSVFDNDEPLTGNGRPDTFEPYAEALRDATAGYMEKLRRYATADDLTEDAQRRMNEIVILGLQAATKGRMSITYFQEIPGNLYVKRLEDWANACRWEMPGHKKYLRSPTWWEICEAVLGRDTVSDAKKDAECKKSATKRMREMQLRLLSCVVNGSPLPRDFVQQAFWRAVQPLGFTDSKGNWNGFAWSQCVAVTCALIRKAQMQGNAPVPSWVLDRESQDRDYLYGRLLAAAHKLELDTTEKKGIPSTAIRMMPRFVQSPAVTWMQLYCKLLPCLKRIGQSERQKGGGYLADQYLRLFGEIERKFKPQDRTDTRPVSYAFLIGFSAQLRELYQQAEERQPAPVFEPFIPPQGRDMLYGCLLAVADVCEWNAAATETSGRKTSAKDGQTNAMLLTSAYISKPSLTWARIHDKLIPYLEKSGVAAAQYVQCLICRIEQGFTAEERHKSTPLGSSFLNGYLSMRLALTTKAGLDADAWAPLHTEAVPLDSRDAVFGALLSLENQVERWVLDREKRPEENRPSNAMRFLTRGAQRPDEVMDYLLQRMAPYQRKLCFPARITQEKERLCQLVAEQQWNTDMPLGPEYLHTFYTYTIFVHDRKER